jgi:hypothetical protein
MLWRMSADSRARRHGVHVPSSHPESTRQAAVSTGRRPPSACATDPDKPLRLPLCAVSPISGAPIRYERIPGRPRAIRRNIVSCPGFSSPLYGYGVDTSCDAAAFAIGSVFRNLEKIVYPLNGAYLFPPGIVSIQRNTKLLLDLYLSSRYDVPGGRQKDYRPVSPFDGSKPTSPALGGWAGRRAGGLPAVSPTRRCRRSKRVAEIAEIDGNEVLECQPRDWQIASGNCGNSLHDQSYRM